MEEFLPLRNALLSQLLGHDGFLEEGDLCSDCTRDEEEATYRCPSCFGGKIYCKAHLLAAHKSEPFHFVEVRHWNGSYWERTSLGSLGFTLYLGHHGDPCPRAGTGARMLHVLHTTGIHDLLNSRIFPATIKCPESATTFACLNEFHLLTTQGKLTGMDYYETLVRLTDNTGKDPPNKKYEEFMRMSRLWRHLKMLKRTAVFLLPGGVDGCGPGVCAIRCPACPSNLDGVSIEGLFDIPQGLPDWVDTDYAQVDANFRLKHKERNIRDVELNGGIAYIVAQGPYKQYVEACGPQTEVNVCDSGLRAVDHANLRGTSAYAASGVGACQCRHMLVRPTGVGDLQKGEKYSNMDYVFASSVSSTSGKRMVISYDIACQWYINFKTRCIGLPEAIKFDPIGRQVDYVIPKFHIAAHGSKCQSKFSLNYRRFMARTDG
ncbi:hypothetical protein SCHPADRAFT_840165, partial [Schizopora paradoxa]